MVLSHTFEYLLINLSMDCLLEQGVLVLITDLYVITPMEHIEMG